MFVRLETAAEGQPEEMASPPPRASARPEECSECGEACAVCLSPLSSRERPEFTTSCQHVRNRRTGPLRLNRRASPHGSSRHAADSLPPPTEVSHSLPGAMQGQSCAAAAAKLSALQSCGGRRAYPSRCAFFAALSLHRRGLSIADNTPLGYCAPSGCCPLAGPNSGRGVSYLWAL
jgi:hypothetical protein